MTAHDLALRNCTALEEFAECVALQKEVWGFSDAELVPLRIFSLAPKIGGQVVGAWDRETLVGYAMAIPGNRYGRPYLHSHMVAVKEGYRNIGLGRKLKLFQRDDAITLGYELMEWTFDPLEIKNAFLNIHRLGAIVRSYRVDFYGVSSSRLQAGLPTDRLLAEWRLDSPRVEAAPESRPTPAPSIEERIQVPAQIYDWKTSQAGRERALAVQLENRQKFQQAFSQGLAVVGFSRDTEGNGVFELGFPTQAELD